MEIRIPDLFDLGKSSTAANASVRFRSAEEPTALSSENRCYISENAQMKSTR